jgi:hypothetical protein
VPTSGSNEQYQPIVLPGQIPAAEHSLPGGPRHRRTVALWCPSNLGYLRTVPAMDPMLDPRSPLICRQECCGLGYITASLVSETSKIYGTTANRGDPPTGRASRSTDSKMASLPPKVDDFRISKSGKKREKLEGPSDPVVLAVASKGRLRFNLSGLIRAL